MEDNKEKLSFNEYQKHAYNLISEEGKKDMITNGVLGKNINIKDMNLIRNI